MELARDANDRRRLDKEAMRSRDAEVARLRRSHVPFRVIAERLDMSLGAVQKSVRRAQRAEEEEVAAELDELDEELAELGMTAFDNLSPDEQSRIELAAVANDLRADPTDKLAHHRLRYLPALIRRAAGLG